MRLTLGITGMDPATEIALKAAFAEANAQIDGRWQLLPDTQADYVVVDMDSMYGPMSWLRLHGAGKTVIGLTSASRVQTEYRLSKPFDGGLVRALLAQLESGVPDERVASPAAVVETSASEPALAAAPEPATAAVETVVAAAPQSETTVPVVEPAAPAPVAATIDNPPPAAPPAPVQRTLGDWLIAGALVGRVRFARDSIVLLIDADRRQYHGPAMLKPLAALFQGTLDEAAFAPVDAAEWDRQAAVIGASQPLSRLVWFGALLAGRGRLAAGQDPAARYQLLKWPQTEREFPKHFRIATAMMKGPAPLPEIADASGVGLDEVMDFVNANLATGFAEPFREPEPELDPPKAGGLFGRLRGR